VRRLAFDTLCACLRLRSALLIATWINSMLWVLEIVQVRAQAMHRALSGLTRAQLYRVRKAYPDDPIMIRVMMLACFIFDTACTIAACATVYLVSRARSRAHAFP
jgi:hypothetical protein